MAAALGSLFRAASSNGSETGIGTAQPMSAVFSTRPGWRSVASRATSEPMLWPISVAFLAPTA